MIFRVLLTASLLTTAAFAADFERTLNVGLAADLYVSTGSGRIQVRPGNDAQIHVKAHLYANGGAGRDVNGRMDQIARNPPIQQSGNAVHVGDVSFLERKLFNDVTIDYEIMVPRSVALNLRTGSGDVEVNEVGRFLKAVTGSGSVRAHGVSGTSDLETGSGDIELGERGEGDVRARTGSGSIRVHGLTGGFTAHTGSGDIEADGTLRGRGRLDTGSGSIRLHLGRDARYNLEASTGSGTIRVPGQYGSDTHHLAMPVNGGGPVLEVRTGSGDIEVD